MERKLYPPNFPIKTWCKMSVIFPRCHILYNSAFCLFDALLRAYTLSLFLPICIFVYKITCLIIVHTVIYLNRTWRLSYGTLKSTKCSHMSTIRISVYYDQASLYVKKNLPYPLCILCAYCNVQNTRTTTSTIFCMNPHKFVRQYFSAVRPLAATVRPPQVQSSSPRLLYMSSTPFEEVLYERILSHSWLPTEGGRFRPLGGFFACRSLQGRWEERGTRMYKVGQEIC
jgi:hypothetical protein